MPRSMPMPVPVTCSAIVAVVLLRFCSSVVCVLCLICVVSQTARACVVRWPVASCQTPALPKLPSACSPLCPLLPAALRRRCPRPSVPLPSTTLGSLDRRAHQPLSPVKTPVLRGREFPASHNHCSPPVLLTLSCDSPPRLAVRALPPPLDPNPTAHFLLEMIAKWGQVPNLGASHNFGVKCQNLLWEVESTLSRCHWARMPTHHLTKYRLRRCASKLGGNLLRGAV